MNTAQIIAAVTALVTLVAAILGVGWFNQRALERQMDAFRDSLTKQMESFRAEMQSHQAAFRSEIKAELITSLTPIRSDIEQIKAGMNGIEKIERQLETIFGKMVFPK